MKFDEVDDRTLVVELISVSKQTFLKTCLCIALSFPSVFIFYIN